MNKIQRLNLSLIPPSLPTPSRPMATKKYFSTLLIFLPFIFGPLIQKAKADDLISARCQSKCLFELEMRHRNNSESRRLLRHQISTLCKEDALCASCIIPCRDLISDAQICGQTLCTGIAEPNQCHQSCAFLAQIANSKPGQCPKSDQKITNGMDSECSAFCDSDGDCPEIDKCCSIGCSRTCLGPLLNDSRLLPRPEGISVQERKRKRSAILRWIMKRMTPQHTATNSNLYVIQWRWSIHRQPETMTPWQTVMVRNKMYAILKHLLAPGRFYLFRVAAVNMFGTYGFSQPSHPPFKLSKEVKAPSPPINLTVLPMANGASEGFAKIGWTPPDSELPIKEYRLSWWKSSMEMANAFEFRQRRSSPKGKGATVDEDYDGGAAEMAEMDGNEEKRNLVLPNYSTKAELDGLAGGQVYMVELYATVDSSEGELRGEPAILFLKTEEERRRMSKTTTMGAIREREENKDLADDGQMAPQFVAELKTPFFEGGRLKTILSWLEHPNCEEKKMSWQKGAPQFRVLIRSLRCLNQLPPQKFAVQGCVATLENLQFRCEYYVRVEKEEEGREKKEKSKLIARLTFSTLPCEQTPSDVPLECEMEGKEEKMNEPNGQIGIGMAQAQPLEAPSKQTNGPIRTTTAKNGGEEEEEEDEWLLIEDLKEEEPTKKGQIQTEKPKEKGTRTKMTPAGVEENIKERSNQEKQKLVCFATSRETAECSWNWPSNFEQKNNPLIGFRTVLSSTLIGTPWNVTIVGPEQRRMHLKMLRPKAVYRFRLQAVTAHGLGAELVEHFSTGQFPSKPLNSSMDLGIHVSADGNDQFPEIVELPWGSSSAFQNFNKKFSTLLLFTAIFIFTFFNNFS